MAQAILIFAQDEGRGIPRGSHGGRVRIRYRLTNGATAVPNSTITERFTAVEDRYHVVPRIIMGTYRTDSRGAFDDVVGFSYPGVLPNDFRVVADQEILANGATAARNRITWTSTMIMVRATDGRRPPTASASVALR
jgi:hypothetical protein